MAPCPRDACSVSDLQKGNPEITNPDRIFAGQKIRIPAPESPVPGWGEAAGLLNAGWYAYEEKWLDAGFSTLSMIPEIGDLMGMGARYIKKLGGR